MILVLRVAAGENTHALAHTPRKAYHLCLAIPQYHLVESKRNNKETSEAHTLGKPLAVSPRAPMAATSVHSPGI